MSGYRLISSDSHVTIPAEAWVEYLSPQFRDAAPRVEVTDEGEFEVFQGIRSPRGASLVNSAGRKPEEFNSNVRRLERGRAGAWDPAERIKDQDIDGVMAEVLYFGGPLRQAQDDDLRLDSFRAYNRWLADFCSHAPKRLVGVAAIPGDGPEVAEHALREAATFGLRAAAIDVFPPGTPRISYSDPNWRPLFKAFADLGIPLSLHVGGDRGGIGIRQGPQFMAMMVANKLGMADAISELIFAGILQELPDLNVVSVEAQIGWISFVQYYADHVFDKHRYWTGADLKEHPSFYWRRQVYATFMEDPVGLREYENIGVDNIMWASDYPHSETTWPNSKSLTDEWFASYDDEDAAKILWANCARVHNIDV
jgi:predicted TIM-barrel fold metal-dependent hydrolase